MASPDILFKGIPRTPTRSYTAELLKDVQPETVVIPCTGSFSLAFVAQVAGVRRIICGDISLYSTVLGYALMDDNEYRLDLRDDVDTRYRDILHLDTPINRAASVLLMVRILQYDGRTVYHQHRQEELIRNAETYLDQLRAQVQTLRALLSDSIVYLPQDMWVTMDEYLTDDKTVNLINPPRYTGGYERMFAGIDAIFDWDEPDAGQFTEADYERMMAMLAEKPPLSLMYYATDGPDPAPQWGSPWRSIFADRPGTIGRSAINWIIANRDPIGIQANRARIHKGKPKFKLHAGAVPPDGTLQAVRVDKPTGDYYRDLFIHKLPGSVTEAYIALLLDGHLLGIIGLHLADLRRGVVVTKGNTVLDHCASVTFAFTCPNALYKRLHKLTLMSLTTTWFWEDVLGSENWFELNGAPKHVKTTMLTPYPENKTARGIMTLDTREKQPDGEYKLTYSTTVTEQTREETLQTWHEKYGKLTKK